MYGKYETKIFAKYVYGKEMKIDETHTFKLCDGKLQAWHFLF